MKIFAPFFDRLLQIFFWQGDFEKRTESIAAKSRLKAEVRFKADIVSPEQWERCI